jgi:glucose/mannose-6-phosphate isomerase
MEKLVAQFPKNISDALEIARDSNLEGLQEYSFSNVVICGMGGSGIGGKMVAQWFADVAKIPIVLLQDYDIPSFISGRTLFIASSYSGNTEETMTAVKQAAKLGAKIVGVCSGGELFKFCQDKVFHVIKVPGGNPPRTMLAFSVVQLVNILANAKIIPADALTKIDKCRNLLNKELVAIKEEAKKLANFAHNKQLVFYSTNNHEATIIRARQQFNENSKQLSWHHVIPEMNHNELVGWGGGKPEHAVVFFESKFISDRNKRRLSITKDVVQKKTEHCISIQGSGANLLEESFYFIHIIDWASLYLAELNQVDVIDIKVIDYLKDQLSKL